MAVRPDKLTVVTGPVIGSDGSPPDNDRLGFSISEAAQRLGISRDALRQRVRRGQIPAYKVEGQWYVSLDSPGTVQVDQSGADNVGDIPEPATPAPEPSPDVVVYKQLVAHLETEIAFQREELRRKDAIIANLVQRLPSLPAPAERPPDPNEAATEPVPASPAPPSRPQARTHWWQFWRPLHAS